MFPDNIFSFQEELGDWAGEGRVHWQQGRLATESPGDEQVSGEHDNMAIIRYSGGDNIHILSTLRPPMLQLN